MDIKLKTNDLLVVFAQGIILMWALWATVVTFTDISSLMVTVELLPDNFPASSHNFDLVLTFLKQYGLDQHSAGLAIFSVIILWIIAITTAYWIAFITFFKNKDLYVYRALSAFLLNMSMVAFFLVTDEIFIQYTAGHDHMNRLLFMITTLYVFLYLVGKKDCDCLSTHRQGVTK